MLVVLERSLIELVRSLIVHMYIGSSVIEVESSVTESESSAIQYDRSLIQFESCSIQLERALKRRVHDWGQCLFTRIILQEIL